MEDTAAPKSVAYEPPSLCKQARLEDVAEGTSSSSFTFGSSGPVGPTTVD